MTEKAPSPGLPTTLSDYDLRNLTSHMEASQRFTELHRLLEWEDSGSGKNAWQLARADDIDGYLSDIRRAWRAARSEIWDGPVEGLAHEVRYALISATMNTLAAAVPPSLIAQLVRTGVWTAEQAVGNARRIPDLEQRVESLTDVAGLEGLTPPELELVQREAEAGAMAIGDAYQRAGALARLSVRLPPGRQAAIYGSPAPPPVHVELTYSTGDPGAATEAPLTNGRRMVPFEQIVGRTEGTSEAVAVGDFIELIPNLTNDGIGDALEFVQGLKGELQRTLAVARLAPRLVELGHLDRANSAVQLLTITGRTRRARDRLRVQSYPDSGVAVPSRWRAEILTESIAGSADPAAVALEALHVASHIDDGELIQQLARSMDRVMIRCRFEWRASELRTPIASAPPPSSGSDGGPTDPDTSDRVLELQVIADVEAEMYTRAVRRLQTMPDSVWRHALTHDLACRLADHGRAANVLALTINLPAEYLTPALIGRLAAAHRGTPIAETLVARITDPARRASCLAMIALHGRHRRRSQALAAVLPALQQGGDDQERADAIVIAAIAGGARESLRIAAESLLEPVARVRAVVAVELASTAGMGRERPNADTADSRSSATLALAELNPLDRCLVDLQLADKMPSDIRRHLITDAASLLIDVAGNQSVRNRVLNAVGSEPSMSQSTQLNSLRAGLDGAGQGSRPDAINTLNSVLELSLRLGGPNLIEATLRSVTKVAHWWP